MNEEHQSRIVKKRALIDLKSIKAFNIKTINICNKYISRLESPNTQKNLIEIKRSNRNFRIFKTTKSKTILIKSKLTVLKL
jgi:hypothetical protein